MTTPSLSASRLVLRALRKDGLPAFARLNTVPANTKSIAVMERLGMLRDPKGDFDHPTLPEGHRLRPHVLYRLGPHPAPPESL